MSKSYRAVTVEQPMSSAVEGAINDLMELAQELRSWSDNMQESNLRESEKAQLVSEAADTLEQIEEVDIPECLDELKVSYTIMRHVNKKYPGSREVRCSNAAAALSAAASAIASWLENHDEHEDRDEVDTLQEQLDKWGSECEGLTIPGMYG